MRNQFTFIMVQICRFLVGGLFLFSGFIKLNDPVGMSFKLEEYFAASVLNLPFLVPYSLSIAVFLIVVEIIVGITIWLGYKTRKTILAQLLLIIFFTFLTFYSAYYNKVTDCGCFGDAIKLTPWQSFYKDLILLVMIVFLMFNTSKINALFGKNTAMLVTLIFVFGSAFLANFILNNNPIIDFRAYKIGVHIPTASRIPENAPKAIYQLDFEYLINGKTIHFSEKELQKIPADAQFVKRNDVLIQKGYQPPIHDFTIEKNGVDSTSFWLQKPSLLLVVSYDLTKTEQAAWDAIALLKARARLQKIPMIVLTAADANTIAHIAEKYQLHYDFYFCDATALKTIERSNPAILWLQNGTIADKKHWKNAHQLVF